MLRIQRGSEDSSATFTLSGRIRGDDIADLQQVLDAETGCRVVIDLRDVSLVDREAVRFLVRCESRGMNVTNCPAYIREWMSTETGPEA